MLSDTMKTVQEAEKKADEVILKAQAKADTIVEMARQEAESLREKRREKAKESSIRAKEQAEITAKERTKKALAEVDREIALFREMVKEKEEIAVELVISKLMEG